MSCRFVNRMWAFVLKQQEHHMAGQPAVIRNREKALFQQSFQIFQLKSVHSVLHCLQSLQPTCHPRDTARSTWQTLWASHQITSVSWCPQSWRRMASMKASARAFWLTCANRNLRVTCDSARGPWRHAWRRCRTSTEGHTTWERDTGNWTGGREDHVAWLLLSPVARWPVIMVICPIGQKYGQQSQPFEEF